MLRNRIPYYLIAACMLLIMQACSDEAGPVATPFTAKDLLADTSLVPKDTVPASAVQTSVDGFQMMGNRRFSGYVISVYPNKKIHTILSVYNGMMHGSLKNYYETGALHEVRHYKDNLATGKQYGYWPNGNPQFEYMYYQDKKEGMMKRWYESGKPYLALHYTNDKEEGLQQAWRKNGKLFINYVSKDGFRYGLQETMLCYKIDKGEIIK